MALALGLLALPTLAQQHARPEEKPVKIRLTAGAKVLTATLLDFGHSRGLIRLGKLDGGVEALRASGPIEVKIERWE